MRKVFVQRYLLYLFIAGFSLLSACKKDKSEQANNDPGVPETNNLQTPTSDRSLLTKDSIFLYAKQIYLWNPSLPSYDNFNPRKYTSNQSLLYALTQIPINQQTGKPYEYVANSSSSKYSFIDDGSVAGQLGGTGADFGFSLAFDGANLLKVRYVYPTSPADVKGLKRGYLVTKVNGVGVLRSSQSDIANLNNALFGDHPSITLSVTKPDQTTADIVVNRATYSINPILFTKIYTIGAKKVGYIVFNSFTTNSGAGLEDAFKQFATGGVTELVVDLRYNGGGSVATSELFTNLIAPPSQNQKVMYTTYWTQKMQDGQATILQNQKFYAKGTDGITRLYSFFDYPYKPTMAAGNQEVFAKKGTLNGVTRVYFLVTGGTASASELLINNLKPVVDVKLIGRTTYGKPVGFFSVKIDKYDLYVPQFQTKNQLNQGDYFDGMTVDRTVDDDLSKEFGDTEEGMLKQALYYSANGKFSALVNENRLSSTSGITRADIDSKNQQLDHDFKGMVETRKLKLK